MRISIIGIVVFLFAVLNASAQDSQFKLANSQAYSTMPIGLPLSMAGDFGEIRPNHFHSGIDIRTEGKEGQPVYAPADGYVSRISISAWGGGKVLYITHPDGYRTVYMHLSAFCGKIGDFVHDYQYSHRVYAFDTELPHDSIKVKKGDLVALTGNTGGSMGPHLHYEIRLAENDQTINPLYFGLPYSDPLAPTIAGIKLYPSSANTTINGKDNELKIYPKPTIKKKKGYKTSSTTDTITISGRFYTGIYTYDQMEVGSTSKNGIEKIELFVDDELFHSYCVPSFLFEETRAINALIDYRQYQRNGEYYILSRRLRGDPTNFINVSNNYGYLQFDDGKTHKLQYRVSDYKGNSTSLDFFVRSDTTSRVIHDSSKNLLATGELAVYYKPFMLVRDGFALSMEAYNLYENDEVVYHSVADAGGITMQHRVAPKRNPLPPHDKVGVTLAIPEKVPQALRSKLVVVCVNGKKVSACHTLIEGDMATATSRNWGGFALRLDTIPPKVYISGSPIVREQRFSVIVEDNLSGVESYSCTVNGEWQVVEHDGKTSSLILDGNLLHPGKNSLVFTITDAVGNSTTKSFTVTK